MQGGLAKPDPPLNNYLYFVTEVVIMKITHLDVISEEVII